MQAVFGSMGIGLRGLRRPLLLLVVVLASLGSADRGSADSVKDRYSVDPATVSIADKHNVDSTHLNLEVATGGHFKRNSRQHSLVNDAGQKAPRDHRPALLQIDPIVEDAAWALARKKQTTDPDLDAGYAEQMQWRTKTNPGWHDEILANIHNISGQILKAEKVKLNCKSDFRAESLEYGYARCPAECPLMGEDDDSVHPSGCFFTCVTEHQCGDGGMDKKATVADMDVGICRRCNVPGCDKCAEVHGDGIDKCSICSLGYIINAQGTCASQFERVWIVVFGSCILLFVFFMTWYVYVLNRDVYNDQGLQEGLQFRTQSKLHRPGDELTEGEAPGSTESLYPLATNFQSVDAAGIAGPGLVLHFNFLGAMVAWPSGVLVIWLIIVFSNTVSLFDLGTLPAVTPAAFCGVRHWGHVMQMNFIDVKILFLMLVYAFTFAGSIAYALVQIRRFDTMNEDVTMGDFGAYVTGLPKLTSSEMPEQRYKEILEQVTGKELVGVSVCWAFHDKSEEVLDLADNLLQTARKNQRESQMGTASLHESNLQQGGTGDGPASEGKYFLAEVSSQPFYLRPFIRFEKIVYHFICGYSLVPKEAGSDEEHHEEVASLLDGLSTSGSAYAVFKTEADCVEAEEACLSAGGFSVPGDDSARIILKEHSDEPSTIKWQNFGVSADHFYKSSVKGILGILVALVVWTIVFYLPYAYYMAAFSYARGEAPSYAASTIVAMLVVGGNQAIYLISGMVADNIPVTTTDKREILYMLTYTFACFLNVVADLCVTMFISYKMLIGANVHMTDGTLLAKAHSVQNILEEFSMQKTLGAQMSTYCFPSTFLIPFIVEPIFAIAAPKHLMRLIVSRYPWLRGYQAERAMNIFVPMDTGRYGDCLLNIYCLVIMFFVPPGFLLYPLAALIVSQMYIYSLDHYRILRSVPRFTLSSYTLDHWAQTLMAGPCALILLAIIFKSNCSRAKDMTPSWYHPNICMHDSNLWLTMLVAAVLHITVHVSILWHVVPYFFTSKHQPSKVSYEEVATHTACTWFSANPVHCLRSNFIYEHKPPCLFFEVGREHLQKANPDIGCFYEKERKKEIEE